MGARFDNSYPKLGEDYGEHVSATPVPAPQWMIFNDALADALDWPHDLRSGDQALAGFAGNAHFEGSEPFATVYAGHQFGSYNPQLGDGRALLLGEWLNDGGQRWDIQLKGAGRTPFSRGGDGRSPVGPVVREFLVSEAMHALGVPTTRALAAIATGAPVLRTRAEPGAILTRVAQSHLRIGTVQYFAMTQGGEGLRALVEYTVERHYSQAYEQAQVDANEPAQKSHAAVLLTELGKKLAALAAHWQSIGFIHGVLNTDNTLLTGETIDYGPCAFMDGHDPSKVFSAIDTQGRYAYRNQPGILHWNLSVLAQCLLPLIDDNEDEALNVAQSAVDAFPQQFTEIYAGMMASKLGLDSVRTDDQALVDGFFAALAEGGLDFTLAFRWLAETANDTVDHTPLETLFTPTPALEAWLDGWRQRRKKASSDSATRMLHHNPVVIARNHWVARAISDAEHEDYALLQRLNTRWQKPMTWQTGDEAFAAAPTADEQVNRTFCGT